MKRNLCLFLLCCVVAACTPRVSSTPAPTPTVDPSTHVRIVTREPRSATPGPVPTNTLRRRLTPYPSPTFARYVVEAGDNLKKIAKDHGISLEALVVANALDKPDYLRIGQVLMVPPPYVTPSARGARARKTAEALIARNRPVATIRPGSAAGGSDRIVYVVDEDDHFHREGCPLLRGKNPIPMSCQEATEMGYLPDETCNPICE